LKCPFTLKNRRERAKRKKKLLFVREGVDGGLVVFVEVIGIGDGVEFVVYIGEERI
jgi:hypothetical protein